MFNIGSLPHWKYEDIITLPMPVVELASEATNKIRDEQNRFLAAIHGVKTENKKKIENSKDQVDKIRSDLASSPGAKIVSRAKP